MQAWQLPGESGASCGEHAGTNVAPNEFIICRSYCVSFERCARAWRQLTHQPNDHKSQCHASSYLAVFATSEGSLKLSLGKHGQHYGSQDISDFWKLTRHLKAFLARHLNELSWTNSRTQMELWWLAWMSMDGL